MSNILKTTSYAPASTHGDTEKLPSAQEKKILPSVFSPFLGLVRRNPFLSSVVISLIITGVIAGAMNLSYTLDKKDPHSRIPHNASGIAIIANGADLDEINQMLTIKWGILGCGAYKLPTYPSATKTLEAVGCGTLDRAVDIYFNHYPFPVYSYTPPDFPWNPIGEKQRVWNLAIFSYYHSAEYLNAIMAPFDTYTFSILAFVIDKGSNQSVPIVTFTASQAPNNPNISSVEVETTSNYTYDSETGPATIIVDSRLVHIEATRSWFARALTMCLFLVNWALTVGSIYIVLVIFGRGGIDDAVLLLPVTIILTIPTLRNLYSCPLSFGIFIDTFGFVLQMMTVSVCSVVLVYCVAIPKSVPKRRASCDDGSISPLGRWNE